MIDEVPYTKAMLYVILYVSDKTILLRQVDHNVEETLQICSSRRCFHRFNRSI